MFKTTASDTEVISAAAEVTPEPPVPLSHLALDLDVPAEGWAAFLGRRGIAIIPDSLGDSIGHGAARRLLDERREAQVRAARKRAVIEQELVEADRQRRSQLWQGVPADRLPPGVAPAAVMLQASRDSPPRRTSVLQEALSRTDTLTFHSLAENPVDEAS